MTLNSEQQSNSSHDRLLGHQISRRLREAGMVLFIALGVFMLLALWSYELSDMSWYEVSAEAQASNLGGIAGAVFADGGFVLLGYLAYLLPLFMGWAAFRLFRRLDEGVLEPRWLVVRVSGAGLALLSGAGLSGLLLSSEGLPEGAGGIVGQLVAAYLHGGLGFTGAALIAGALFLSGLTLSVGLSWLAVAEWVGKWTIFLGHSCWYWISHRFYAALAAKYHSLREARAHGGLLRGREGGGERIALPWLSSPSGPSSGGGDLEGDYTVSAGSGDHGSDTPSTGVVARALRRDAQTRPQGLQGAANQSG
jgi:S-DNA-T family DNA segregation ATPase FtsK/SpoIIIE